MPLRVGICGLGSATERAHLPALRSLEERGEIRIVAVAEPSSGRLAEAERLVPGARRFSTLQAMLAGTELDLLVVATPPSAHTASVLAGLEAGLHVVCEKPLALRREEIASLRRTLAEQAGAALVSVHQYEHAPAWRTLARVIQGAIAAHEEWKLTVSVERPGTDPLSAGGWRSQPDREGGILGDHAVHYLAMAWKIAPRLRLLDVERRGAGGRETARLELGGHGGSIDLTVSYAGSARHNRIRLMRPAQGLTLAWDDSLLAVSHAGDRARRYGVTSLAARDVVNSLYLPFYADVVANLQSAAWRRARNQESLGVATLLAAALERVPMPVAAAQGSFIGDLRAAAQAVLLAFADLGVHRGSDRDLLLHRARSLDPANADSLAGFLDLAIAEGLITPSEAGRLRLAPDQARQLAQWLDAESLEPIDQASAWARQLGNA